MTPEERFKKETGLLIYSNNEPYSYNSAFVEWLKDQITWKSVEDGLPEVDDYYLTMCDDVVQKMEYYNKRFHNIDSDGEGFHHNQVTKWLPIPK